MRKILFYTFLLLLSLSFVQAAAVRYTYTHNSGGYANDFVYGYYTGYYEGYSDGYNTRNRYSGLNSRYSGLNSRYSGLNTKVTYVTAYPAGGIYRQDYSYRAYRQSYFQKYPYTASSTRRFMMY